MKKEVEEKIFKEGERTQIPARKKIWISMTKFERYPEMASEGVGKALKYLCFLMFIFALVLGLCYSYQICTTANKMVDYMEENFSSIDYKDGILNLELNNDENVIITDMGTVIVDTSDITDAQLEAYQNTLESSNLGIIWLKDHIVIKVSDESQDMNYEDLFNIIGIDEFDKTSLLEFIDTDILNPQMYVSYFVVMLIYLFVAYFVSTLLNVLLLSVFGVLTSLVARLKIRYRAVFNMSIYAITLSTILELIYMAVTIFTDFNIKYFDIMYSAISYICLAAAIFMIKSDVVKQQVQMMKISKEENKEQKVEEQNKQEEKEEEQDKQEEKKEEEKQEEDENKEKEDDKKDNEGFKNEAEGQGSNA